MTLVLPARFRRKPKEIDPASTDVIDLAAAEMGMDPTEAADYRRLIAVKELYDAGRGTDRVSSKLVAPAWGWRTRGAGRISHVTSSREWQSTTNQACGLSPLVAGSGAPASGVPIGRHLHYGEVVCADPHAWLDDGLITNTGIFVAAQPGVGKSAIIKRLARGLRAFGIVPMALGDTKGEYVAIIEAMGGQVIRIGRGMDRMNPLDAGPLKQALDRLGSEDREHLLLEIRGRRLTLLMALCSLVRTHAPMTNSEEVILGAAIDILQDADKTKDPIIPDVMAIINKGPEQLMVAAHCRNADEYHRETHELHQTLQQLCTGALKGVFDGPTTRPFDLDAPGITVDISRVAAAGDTLVSTAMLSTWAYGFGAVDAAAALADYGAAPRRHFFLILDELWRALRGGSSHGGSSLVEHADALTRLNRSKGISHAMITHSLADLDALSSHEDRAKARGFVERCAITILGGLSPRELHDIAEIRPLTGPEMEMVTGWQAPDSWQPDEKHPGRGKYLIKTGSRVGIPVELSYVADEETLYHTDPESVRTRRPAEAV